MKLSLLEDLKIEDIQKLSKLDNLKTAFDIVQSVQHSIAALNENDCTGKQNIIKVGTILTVALFAKIRAGKLPKDFSARDWRDVAFHIQEFALDAEETKYSIYVFMFYASFIENSLSQIAYRLSEKKKKAISSLADELKCKSELLENGQIEEVEYIDGCLWICLEAMIKLTAGTIDASIGFEREQVVEAAALLAFECGRLKLYNREYELINGYLENQKILDAELATKFDEYKRELKTQAENINELIDSAFSKDAREALRNSVIFARTAGVDEKDLLKSDKEIEQYFM